MTQTMHVRRRDRGARRDRGFTLLEVMLALSILAVTLVGLLGRTTGNVRLTQESAMRGTAAALARGQMYEIEDHLLREGFQDLDQNLEGDFQEQGWPQIHWEAAIEKVEIPGMEGMKAMQGGAGEPGAEGDGGEGQTQGAGGMIGSILSMGGLGGMGGGEGGEDTSVDAAMISSQFEMFRQVLEASIRKVTLTVTWKVGNEDQQMVVVCYFTDPDAMQKVLPGLGGLPAGGGGEDGTGEGPESGRGDGGGGHTPGSPPKADR
jgi:prepilin-type N-terminal cleavage/methylation domain-containing protein